MLDASPRTPVIPGPFEVATRPRVVLRALKYMVIVGAILITINHGDAIVRGDMNRPRLLRMLLTCLVPYCVSTLSSVEAVRSAARDAARSVKR
jgi:hypothetical protein